jgi:acyl-coenzyme A synthetase/AMP-(fatty) acid ligase
MVERLPRNATGKLPQHALKTLADRHLQPNEST